MADFNDATKQFWQNLVGRHTGFTEIKSDDELRIALEIDSVSGDVVWPGSAAGSAKLPSLATRDAADQILYQPSSTSLLKWRALRQQVLAGTKQGHIVALGDSVTQGAGSTAPKYVGSWVGQFRKQLNARFGDAGTGIVLAKHNIHTDATLDDRFTFAGGASITDQGFGLFSRTCYRLDAVAGVSLSFIAPGSEFWVYNYAGAGGINTAFIDGVSQGTFRNITGGTVPTFESIAGYASNFFVTKIPSTAGTKTLRLEPSTVVNTNDLFVFGVEARYPTLGTFRVTNAGYNGMSFVTLAFSGSNNDEVNALNGLPAIDAMQPDLLIVGLGVNDWQAQQSVANLKSWLTQTVQRQRSSGTNAKGGNKPNGEAVLLWNPQPDLVSLNFQNPTWSAYRDAFYEVANEQDVALIDLGGRWKDFPTANGLSLFADTIHPTDKGAGDIAGSVYKALFLDA